MKTWYILSLSLFSLTITAHNEFIDAVKQDNFARASQLLAEGANPNTKDSEGTSVFNLALENGSTKMINQVNNP